jgi:serpin B
MPANLNRRPARRLGALFLVLVIGTVACGSSTPTVSTSPSASAAPSTGPVGSPPPAASASPSASASAAPSASPSATPSASPSTPPGAQLLPGGLAVTVTKDVRVRSKPGVAADSQKYSPTLPSGTKLAIMGGPVVASGYTWIEVGLLGTTLKGGVDRGWVAVADHDGTPWVAVDASAVTGFETVKATSAQVAGNLTAARQEASQANAFGIDLYGKLLGANASKAFVFSPTSIVDALAMARAGAKGNTATQMDAVLHASGWDQMGLGIASLDRQLAARDGTYVDNNGDTHALSLHLANTVFAQNGFPLQPEYLSRMGKSFGAGVQLVDFQANTAGAIDAINGWVRNQTLGRIPVIVSPSNINAGTRLALVNAIYLKANWAREFDTSQTANRSFKLFDGSTVSVPTMRQFGGQEVAIASGGGWKATELYYRGPGGTPLSMTLVLPDNLKTFEKSLSPSVVATIEARIHDQTALLQKVKYSGEDSCGTYAYEADLRLPRFGIDTGEELSALLGSMGMRDAITAGVADFTGINPDAALYIGGVIHKATIDVDEKGTTAAAATVVSMDTGGCTGPGPGKDVILAFNHPFMFYIRDVKTGAILFIGRVVDPSHR